MTHSYRAVIVLFVLSLFVSSSAVTAFAQTGDIDPNGAGPQSCITVPTNIRYRDSDATTGGAVSMVQEFLISKGYMQTEATGYFGSVTFASVKKYQAMKGLSATGYVGPLTRSAMSTDSCSTDPNAGQNSNTTTTTNTSTSATTNTTNTTTTNTPTPTRPATGAISSNGGAAGCTVVLGANTCPVTVQWSSLNYAGSPSAYLSACQTNSSGVCTASAAQYLGASGSHLFNLWAGTSWLFSLWGTDYLGQLTKTDQLVLRGTCITGSAVPAGGSGCVSGATPATQFVTGPGNGNTTTTQPTTNSSGQSVGVSNSPTGPFVSTATNSGKIYSRITGLVKANNPKGCATPRGGAGCSSVTSTSYRDFTSTEWGTSATTVVTITNGGVFPNGNYDSYIAYPGQAPIKVGTFSIWTIDPATYTGPVFGAGGEGIPGNQPVTYGWYIWMPLLGMLTAEHSGFANPSAACTASNIGSTYYLGNKGGQDMIAQCVGGQGLTSYPTMTASTLNKPGTTTTTTTSSPSGTANCSYTRGTFMNGEQTIEWVNGGATCTTPPADATGWVLQSVGIWHRVVSSSSTTTTTTTTAEACSYTTGSFTSGINTVDWACGSASCTGAPSGTGWVDQGNGCYQRLVPSGAGSADTSAAGAGTGGGSGGAAAGGSGGGIGGNNGDDGGAVGGGVSI